MIGVLRNTQYRRLFAAQVVALLGTGLLTVALGLLAFDLAGPAAGAVLGTALAIKMVAYVGLAPVASALAERVPRKTVLVGADLVRAGVACALPFVDAIWQVYVLIFVLQAASATFTPAFQALIPDILTDEAEYTRALSLSRLAYELENLASPALAAALLLLISFNWLFAGTFLGFVVSALLVITTALPARENATTRSFTDRLTRGTRIYLATPRLRGLLACNIAGAAAGAFVIVNTVVAVRDTFGRSESEVALALAAFGAGAMVAALCLPRLLDKVSDRAVMLWAAMAIGPVTLAHAAYWVGVGPNWPVFLGCLALTGLCYSAIFTPVGRIVSRSAHPEDRPAVFAAQFALSHAGWLFTYPLAGWLGNIAGLGVTMLVLGAVALVSAGLAWRLWPTYKAKALVHDHPDLPHDHPHMQAHRAPGGTHRHAVVIDDQHRAWPTQG
ncbi:MAG: MFS transporter [Pseudomonadota bacterium]